MSKNLPNILFLMVDGMQGRILDDNHPCRTPNLDELASEGIRFTRAYSSSPVCSPARAGIMTGLLPHNHGVLWVNHTVDEDQGVLRKDKPHWAQRLKEKGYRTGYFGKWHASRDEDIKEFGWDVFEECRFPTELKIIKARYYKTPYYHQRLHYAVVEESADNRAMGYTVKETKKFLKEVLNEGKPWCCFVSTEEPHDPFVTSKEIFEQYDIDSLPLPPSINDNLEDKPNVYSRLARVWNDMSERERKEAMGCYYGSITELDMLFGQLIDMVKEAGQFENTIIIFTTDHGEYLGAHRLYGKNFAAFEEAYNIPLIIAGPGIAKGITTNARVGSHEIAPTLMELLGLDFPVYPDSRSFAKLIGNPKKYENEYITGYAEYFGNRFFLTQRVIWDGDWKYVFNGYDFDELYNLKEDSYELNNLIDKPEYKEQAKKMLGLMWKKVKETNDRTLYKTEYPAIRIVEYGPGLADEY